MRRKKRKKMKRVIPVFIAGFIIILLFVVAASSLAFLFVSAGSMHEDEPVDIPKEYHDDYQQTGLGKKEGAYTFIVGGTDKDGTRTDSLLLVYFNPNENALSILSIPRDTYVNTNRPSHKVNSVYAYGKGPLLKEEMSQTLGIDIDYYVVVNLKTFKEVVDLIGGVPINISFDMDYDDPAQDLHIHIPQGPQVLDGEDAEGFVRYRSGYAAADLARIEAQKIFMSSFINTALAPKNIIKIPEIIYTVFSNIKTDMPLTTMVNLAKSALGVDMSNIKMYSLPGEWYSAKGYYTAYKPETVALLNESFNPYETEIVNTDLVELGRSENAQVSTEGETAAELETKAPPSKTKDN